MHRILILMVLTISTASTTTWIVDDDGCGNFTKIQDAINASADGDEIIVRGGTYHENLMVDRSVLLISDGNPVVDGNGANDPIINITAANVTLEGFTIANCTDDRQNSGAVVVRSDGCKVLNNTISNNAGHGVLLFNSGKHAISGNYVHNNAHAGMRFFNSRYNEISGNEVCNNEKPGIGLQYCEKNTLTENHV
ncbi:MAG: right-handed parallel beta-helix repeat-containing protein, partial [Euryarchaeota archaeon]|nr:right-handed parallel beta-helix repeat-containing protein [Euryarchaeota archaeon]